MRLVYDEAHFSYGEITAIVRHMTKQAEKYELSSEMKDAVRSFLKGHDLQTESYAVAVSGGPDSMALAHALCATRAEEQHGGMLHVLTVDHGLRMAAKEEAVAVKVYFEAKPDVKAEIFTREVPSEDKNVRVQENARNDRYALMADYCREHDLKYLFLAHHANDQMETILFRLAKGSGLDGLSGMKAVQKYDDDLTLLRPVLQYEKEVLLSYCKDSEIPFFEDASNQDGSFARVRMRQAQKALEDEGFSAQRLSVLARRLGRAKDALEFYTSALYEEALIKEETGRVVFSLVGVESAPEEMRFRLFQRVFDHFAKSTQPYGPRREKLERLVSDLFASPAHFKKRSLGACHVSISRDGTNIVIEHSIEHSKA